MSGEINKKFVLRNRIEQYRKSLDLKQEELGNLVGLSRQTIGSLERGVYEPTGYTCALLCKALNVKFEDLFYLEEI